MHERNRRIAGGAFWTLVAVLWVGAAAWSQQSTRPVGLMVLFTMNDLEERADGTTQVTRHYVREAPQLVLGGGSVAPKGQSGVAFTDAERKEHPAKQAAAWTSGINDDPPNGMLLRFDSTGYRDLMLRFDIRSTRTGSPFYLFQYRVGGVGPFEPVGTQREIARDGAFHEVRIDLSAYRDLNSSLDVELQWVFAPGTGGNGTTRIDNVQVTGTPLR